MTLLGWSRFQETEIDPSGKPTMSFTQFMGHYGQMVNIISLVLSSIVFPFFMHRLGLRLTLRLFPTLLLIANIVAFGALPGNLPVLFLSLSLLKAMTYSIHDPAKEILYIPTSNAIKFKSKFWIDVVGARFAKAIGSSINKMSGSVHGSIRVASAPSLLTAAALWYVCYRVGGLFDELVATDTIVGVEIDPRLIYKDHSADNEDDDNEDGNVHETMESVELTAF
jgi:AAA family ATP:ADP antiporter